MPSMCHQQVTASTAVNHLMPHRHCTRTTDHRLLPASYSAATWCIATSAARGIPPDAISAQSCGAGPRDVQARTRSILNSLFPSWLPPAFKVMFARPLPALSNKLNAQVTAWTCQWLMGPCAVNDVELADGSVGKAQGVLVERCDLHNFCCTTFATFCRRRGCTCLPVLCAR